MPSVALFLDDPELDRCCYLWMKAHFDIVNTQFADGVFEVDGAAIYLIALFIEQFGDMLGGYRTEEAILLADLDLRGERLRFQLFGEDLSGAAVALG